ncbi:MAG: 6,7-dimethyl-8-ribityllumazine synthase [Candidatus Diapherotrites archaeon]
MRIGIVVSEFHKEIAEEMLKTAIKEAEKRNYKVEKIFRVVGAFDAPLALKRMLASQEIDAAIVLGAVVQGETSHDEVVAFISAEKIAELSLKYDKPVGYGVSGPRMTISQAKARAKEFAQRAVEAISKYE